MTAKGTKTFLAQSALTLDDTGHATLIYARPYAGTSIHQGPLRRFRKRWMCVMKKGPKDGHQEDSQEGMWEGDEHFEHLFIHSL